MEESGALGVGLQEGFALEGGDGGCVGCGMGCEEGDGVVEIAESCMGVLERVGPQVGGVWGLGLGWRLDEDGIAVSETDELGAVIVGGGIGWVRGYEGREGLAGGFEEGWGELWLWLWLLLWL